MIHVIFYNMQGIFARIYCKPNDIGITSTDTSKGDNDKTNHDAQTYTIDCGGAVGNMIKIEDQDSGNLGHGISEVKVFGTG